MTLREYYQTRFAPDVLKDKPHKAASDFNSVVHFCEVLYYQQSDQLQINKLTENHIKAVRAAALSCGYARRTVRNFSYSLRAILRHARPLDFPVRNAPIRITYPDDGPPTQVSVETLLVVYLRHVFFWRGASSRTYEQSMWCIVEKLSESLGEPARVRHLTDDAIAGMLAYCEKQGLRQTTICRYKQGIKTLWRHAMRRGLAMEGKYSARKCDPGSGWTPLTMLPVVPEDGSLWWYCVNRYFLLNLRIRSQQTRDQYHIAMKSFKTFLGHEPMLADLDDDIVTGWKGSLANAGGLSPVTINERVGRVITLWTWLAKKKVVEQFPFVPRLKEPKRAPRAWTQSEMQRIFEAATKVSYPIGPNKGSDWWPALLKTLWDTGARIGEILACKWSWLEWQSGILSVPAEVRKGAERDMVYTLGFDTLEALTRIRSQAHELIFHWPWTYNSVWTKYKAIVKAAGLPNDRNCGFHKIRRTVASYVQAAGHDACMILRHSTPAVTIESYLDPAIVGTSRPCDILPRLESKGGGSC